MANNKDFKVKNGIKPTAYHEGVGTVVSESEGYYLAGASYDSVSFDASSQSSYMFDFGFADSGTKMYVQKQFDGGTIYQYTLSTAYDISTASYASKSYSAANGESGFVITPDGSTLYISANDGDAVYQYTFGTAFDVSTLGSGTQMFSTSSVDTQPDKCRFNNDGSKFFLLGRANNRIYEYSVSTAYDLSTASYSNNSLLVSSQASAPLGFEFSSDGTKLVVSDNSTNSVYLYNLSTAFDITTATYSGTSFLVSGQDSVPSGISFNSSGSKMFVLGNSNNTVFQYSTVLNTNTLDLSTGAVFDLTPTSDVQLTLSNPAASGTVSQATLLLNGAAISGYNLAGASYDSVSFSVGVQAPSCRGLAFNNDGTKMYVVGQTNDAAYQYSLSTAYDISTASYDSVSFSVASEDSLAHDITFNGDGTKMYIVGDSSNSIYQYSLSTAFDLSTASYDSVSLSVGSQDGQPRGIDFNNDGTKMYLAGGQEEFIYQYSLSTAYNLSTASYDSVSLDVGTQGAPEGVSFNNDGTEMYIVINFGTINDSVVQYSLSTAFDLSTASYSGTSFSISGQEADPTGVTFNDDGTKMYVIGQNVIYQYSTATGATITYPSTLEWPSGTAPTSPAIGETDVITFSTTDGGTTYKAVHSIDGAS